VRDGKNSIAQAALTGSAGLVVAVFTIIASASYAALIFHGPLQPYTANGMWMGLVTAVIVGLLVAITSSCPGAIAIPQDRIAPILAILSASIAAAMPNTAPDQICLVVVAAIVLVTLITGLFLYGLGWLKLGNLIRYIPYPVIGGFLAGSGWLLVCGGIRVMTGRAVTFGDLPWFFQSAILVKWVAGVVFGSLLFVLLKRARHQLIMPATLVLGIAAFYIFLALTGQSLDQARQTGWLAEFPHSTGMHRITLFSAWPLISWSLVLNHANIIATILLTSVVSILLTASALELVAHQEIDLNAELRSAGLSTFMAAFAGGMVGFHSLSMSRLALSMGAKSRWVGVISALICGLVLLLGGSIVSFVPQFVRGGLLFFLGIVFLWEWVYEASRKLTRLDYCVVLIILAVVGAVGYPEGVATGIIAAIVLFVHNYSRVDVVTHAVSGANLRSNVERPVEEVRFLREKGDQIYVLRLQGFIFFGTATRVLQEVRLRALDTSIQPLRFVIIDFRRVTGLDSSAVFSLWKVHQLSRKLDFTLLMSHVEPAILRQLEMGGLRQSELEHFLVQQDLDHAMEYCEAQLLLERDPTQNGRHLLLTDQLRQIWPTEVSPDRLLLYLEKKYIPKGDHLIRQSEISECMYFIESGQVTAKLELEDGRWVRLRSQGPGTIVGEVGMFLGGRRTASVITEQASTVYCLSADALSRMRTADPTLALAFHRCLVCLLSERLTSASNMLRDLQS
jgi:SulP family sulfate permease